MNLELWHFPFILLIGFGASFINSLAGGGSALSIPLMILIGIPPTLANGTNRVGIFFGNIGSVSGLAKKGYLDSKVALKIIPWVAVGAILGGLLGIQISDKIFQICLAIVLIAIVVVSRFKKSGEWEIEKDFEVNYKVVFTFLAIGFYGGFIQVGVGFVLILSLSLYTGFNILKVNALKGVMAITFIGISVVIFGLGGKIIWSLALTQALGSVLGGFVGSKVQVKKGVGFVEKFVSIISIVLAIKLIVDVI